MKITGFQESAQFIVYPKFLPKRLNSRSIYGIKWMIDENDGKIRRAQIYYSIIKERYDLSWENKTLLDEKGSRNIIFVGILLGLYSGVVSIIITSLPEGISLNQLIKIHYIQTTIFILELAILLVSFLSAGYACSKLDKWEVVPFKPNVFIEQYASRKDIDIIVALGRLTKNTADAVEKNDIISEKRATLINQSFYFLSIGLIGIFVCFISLVFVILV